MTFWFYPVQSISVFLLAVLTSFAANSLAAEQKDDGKGQIKVTDVERLQSDWILVESVAPNGNVNKHRAGMPDTNHFNFYVQKDRAIFHFDGTDPEDEIGMRFTVDSTKTPKEVDLVGVFSTISIYKTGRKTLGIYKFDGDTLTLCLAPEGENTRPTDFKSGKDRNLYKLIRSKKPISEDSGVAGYRPKWSWGMSAKCLVWSCCAASYLA